MDGIGIVALLWIYRNQPVRLLWRGLDRWSVYARTMAMDGNQALRQLTVIDIAIMYLIHHVLPDTLVAEAFCKYFIYRPVASGFQIPKNSIFDPL